MAAWIFQVNPTRIDIDAYVRSTNPVQLKVINHFRNSVRPGDRVFLWRADGGRRGTGGVIGLGSVVDEPDWVEPSPTSSAFAFWRGGTPTPRWAAWVQLDKIRLTESDGMLLRTDLEEHPTLSTLSVLTFRAASNFRLSEQQDEDLLDLWETSAAGG